jgi:hypothetical protein
MLKRLKQAWKRDRLGVLGVVSAVIALAVWGFPVRYVCYIGLSWTKSFGCEQWPYFEKNLWFAGRWWTENILDINMKYEVRWFTTERLPAIGAFLALAVILLLLRRR